MTNKKEVIIGVLTLSTAFVGLIGVQSKNYIDEINSKKERIQILEKRAEILQSENFNIKSDLLDTRIYCSIDVESIADLESFLDFMPLPMYLKEIIDGESKMLFINEAYERAYDITKERYIGSSDYEIWPKEIASKMLEYDLKILKYKNSFRDVNDIFINNKNGKVYSFKFYVDLQKERHGVGGIITDHVYSD